MINKDLLMVLFAIAAVTVLLFTIVYTPPSNDNVIKTFTRMTSLFEGTTITLSYSTATIENIDTYTVTVIVNSTRTIPITMSFNTSYVLYYDTRVTFTVYMDSIVYDETTTTIPDVDISIIMIGELSYLCDSYSYITGSDSFWPELFLSYYGYTTGVLTAVDPCKNAYLVTAG